MIVEDYYLIFERRDVINGSIDHIDIGLCTEIDCEDIGVTHLPLWPNVTRVYCDNCPLLEQLPLWPNVIRVLCLDCPKLKQLPLWPNITEVSCSGCLSLDYKLPLWPNIINIYCETEKIYWFYKKTGKMMHDPYIKIQIQSHEEYLSKKFLAFKKMNKCFDDNVFHIIEVHL